MNWANTEHHRFKDHLNEAMVFSRRIIVAFLLVVFFFSILIYRFYSLQVEHYQNYATLSDRNRIQVRPIAPNRGLIYDRHGDLLAENRPSFTLSLVPERIQNLDATIKALSEIIPIDDGDVADFKQSRKQRRRPYEPVPLRFRLTDEEIALLAVNKFAFQGMKIEAQLVRHYPYAELFAHSIGYVGRINEKELSGFSEEEYKRYSGTRSIGKIGIEKYYESTLLGEVGHEYIETNAHGRRLRLIEESQSTAGQNLHLFLDAKIQKAAAEALRGRRGALVAIDVASGGVLAMASTPSFDPNLFVTGISFKDYRALNESTDLPLFNRTIQGQYPPGSTLKPMLGLGGLEDQIVTQETVIEDPGFYQLENDERFYREWKQGGHGEGVDLEEAIVESCDIYFYDLAFRMGVDRMHAFGLNFGLGESTNLDIPSERDGLWPSREWKKRTRGLDWYPGNSLNMSIGQGDVLATPLQLAVMTATLANKGLQLRPRLVEKINGIETPLLEEGRYQGYDENWQFIHDSMRNVVHSLHGTAASLGRKLKYKIAGKTGTAQVVGIAQGEKYDSESLIEAQRDHTLFVGFAPVEKPELALAVIVENGEKHGKTTFPVVKAVFDTYFQSQKTKQIKQAK
ncbi:MAG: penicillin-binding protein 2 [Agarilytica sp.]